MLFGTAAAAARLRLHGQQLTHPWHVALLLHAHGVELNADSLAALAEREPELCKLAEAELALPRFRRNVRLTRAADTCG